MESKALYKKGKTSHTDGREKIEMYWISVNTKNLNAVIV